MLKADINDITFKGYSDKIILLKNIHFNLNDGNIYTILGKNGSGKSTLIKSLTNLQEKSSFNVNGKVMFDGKDILSLKQNEINIIRKTKIRYVLQDLTNNFNPIKKLKYYFEKSGCSEEQFDDLLKSFLLPDYKTISELYPYEISGGMAQRLSLLFAMLPEPKLIILDEPTSAIDYLNMNLIKFKLKQFADAGNCVLIVTQDIGFAKGVTDYAAYLSNGFLSDFTESEKFFSDRDTLAYNDIIKSYIGLQ